MSTTNKTSTTTTKIDLAAFLNQQYLCASLTIKEVQTLLEYTVLVTFNQHEIIANIGEIGECLYFTIHGDAILSYDNDGRETEIARIHEGQLVGEMSFFDKKPRSVRMRAGHSHSQLLKLTRPMYERLRIEHPYIAVNLLEHAIISLDHLFRSVSSDVATFSSYLSSVGRK